MRILIAEDDRSSRRLLEATLRKWGHDVVVSTDGREARELLLRDDRPRLAILDWMMPGATGIELTREVRSNCGEQYVYIILLTARTSKQDRLDGMEAGADDYLSKPLDSQELEVRIRAAERIIRLQNELIAARDRLREQATHDELTGLLNRKAILDTLSHEIARARREDTCVCAIMVDLDRFKSVNDTYGHNVGDEALREAAHRLQAEMRPYDMIGRYGGEEFLIVVPRCDPSFAAEVGERLRRGLAREPMSLTCGDLPLTASLGAAAMRGQDVPCRDELIQVADQAMYQAKQQGRNRVIVADGLVGSPCHAGPVEH